MYAILLQLRVQLYLQHISIVSRRWREHLDHLLDVQGEEGEEEGEVELGRGGGGGGEGEGEEEGEEGEDEIQLRTLGDYHTCTIYILVHVLLYRSIHTLMYM